MDCKSVISRDDRLTTGKGGLAAKGIDHCSRGFAVCHVTLVDAGVLQKTLPVDHHGQHHDAGIIALLLAMSKPGYAAPCLATLEIGVGQIVQNYLVFQIEQLFGAPGQVLLQRSLQ